VFSATSPATAAALVNTDTSLLLPTGIGTPSDPSDTNLFVADLVATGASTPSATSDLGAIFIVPQAGGTATPISGTVGYQPRGLVLAGSPDAGDTLYFTGIDPTTGLANVFTMGPGSSGTPFPVITSGSLNDPSGVAVDAAGDIFVFDTVSTLGSGLSSVVQIVAGTGDAEVYADGIPAGYPSGLAVSADGSTLWIAQLSPGGTDAILTLTVSTGNGTTSAPSGIGSDIEPGGLHLDSSVSGAVDFVDGLAGAVYQVTP
jgi:hypothetical protein